MLFPVSLCFLCLQLSHFEKYNTNVMYLPIGYDFTLWGCTFALMLAFFKGVKFYSEPLIFGLNPTNIVELVTYLSPFLLNYPQVVYNIYKWVGRLKISKWESIIRWKSFLDRIEIEVGKWDHSMKLQSHFIHSFGSSSSQTAGHSSHKIEFFNMSHECSSW